MSLTYILLGFAAKIVTGLDDVITHIPILSSVTKRRRGQIAFSLGNLFAVILAITFAMFFASFLKNFSYHNYIVSILLFFLAVVIYFDLFIHNPREKVERKYQDVKAERVLRLFGIGFIASLATVFDDIIVFTSIFTEGFEKSIFAGLGILTATIIEIMVVIFFASSLIKIKYKKEIASLGLILLSLLILFRVI